MPRCFNLFCEIFVLKPLTIALYKHTLVKGILYRGNKPEFPDRCTKLRYLLF